jgi:putative endonuclease
MRGVEHSVYVLRSLRNGRYYIGFARDVGSRLAEHNRGRVTATRYLVPWEIVFTEIHPDATSARRREYQIKRMKSRKYIEELIRSQHDQYV